MEALLAGKTPSSCRRWCRPPSQRKGGRFHVGMVAAFKSECRPACDRNTGRFRVGNRGRFQSESASPDIGEILASDLTSNEEGDASLVGPLLDQITRPIGAVLADGAYDGEPVYRAIAERAPDAEVIIPPRATAVTSDTADTAPTQRDRHIQIIKERGRLGWQRAVHYGRRSLVEVAMLRYKVLIGRSLRARTLPAQKVEAATGCKVMNAMTSLGLPVSRKIT